MSASPIIEARREQMFPVLDEHDIARLKRFGEVHDYETGAHLMKAGEIAPGLILILAGNVQVSQGGGYSPRQDVIQHGPGNFAGELAQLSVPTATLIPADSISRQRCGGCPKYSCVRGQ